MRQLLFITFPQGFQISKNCGHPTLASEGNNVHVHSVAFKVWFVECLQIKKFTLKITL